MTNQTSLVDLVAGYDAYSTVEELNVRAVGDAPATSPICARTITFTIRYSEQAVNLTQRAVPATVALSNSVFNRNR